MWARPAAISALTSSSETMMPRRLASWFKAHCSIHALGHLLAEPHGLLPRAVEAAVRDQPLRCEEVVAVDAATLDLGHALGSGVGRALLAARGPELDDEHDADRDHHPPPRI